jgi:hypothetical protein
MSQDSPIFGLKSLLRNSRFGARPAAERRCYAAVMTSFPQPMVRRNFRYYVAPATTLARATGPRPGRALARGPRRDPARAHRGALTALAYFVMGFIRNEALPSGVFGSEAKAEQSFPIFTKAVYVRNSAPDELCNSIASGSYDGPRASPIPSQILQRPLSLQSRFLQFVIISEILLLKAGVVP